MCFKVLATVATVTSAVAIAACGSSSNPPVTVSSAAGQGVAYADCMRSHGVSGFQDPSAGGGVALPSTINQQSPSYQTAEQTCAKLQPGPTGGPPKASERARILGVKFSRCMRRHGLPDFPDPSLSIPPPSEAQGIIRGGMYWSLPAGTVQSPAFEKAAASCGLHPPRAVAAA